MFAPYTSIATNIIFLDNKKKTDEVWFYRVDMPEGYKHFSKTKPMRLEHFDECMAWWYKRHEIVDEDSDTFKAKKFTADEIKARNYDLDLCGYPTYEEEVLSPEETIREFKEKREALNAKIDRKLKQIEELLGVQL